MKRPENLQYTWNDLSPFGYDAAWAIALMLNRSVGVLEHTVFSDNKPRRLEDFTYDDKEMAQVFFDLLKETDFTGATVSMIAYFSAAYDIGIFHCYYSMETDTFQSQTRAAIPSLNIILLDST